MSSYFNSKFFARNRRRLRQQVGADVPIVITANGLLQRGGDSTLPFHQDSNFWYLTGIDEPDVVLVLDADDEYLIAPERSDYQDIFNGSVNAQNLGLTSGVKEILTSKVGWSKLAARLRNSEQVATCAAPPSYIESHGMYTNPARARLIAKMKRHNSNLELLDVREQLAKMRMIKQQPEIAAIQKAVDITSQAFGEIQKRSYKFEYELEADLTQLFRKAGANGHAYDPIVGAGKNACVLHYMKNADPIKPGDLMLIDAAAEVSHYAADITRTFSLSGKPSKRQSQVYDAVKAVQDFAFGLQKPGALIKENEQKVEKFMGEKLRELGLIKTITSANVRKHYPHSTSHFLGLDVHDAGDYKMPLEPGVVLTVEPGIYIPEEGIGVRIEDDVLITQNGVEILSRALPRQL